MLQSKQDPSQKQKIAFPAAKSKLPVKFQAQHVAPAPPKFDVQAPGIEAFQFPLGVFDKKRQVTSATARRLARSMLTPVSKRYSSLGYKRCPPQKNISIRSISESSFYDPKLPRYLQPTKSSLLKSKNTSNISMMTTANGSSMKLNLASDYNFRTKADISVNKSRIPIPCFPKNIQNSKKDLVNISINGNKKQSSAAVLRGKQIMTTCNNHCQTIKEQPNATNKEIEKIRDYSSKLNLSFSTVGTFENNGIHANQEIETARDAKVEAYYFGTDHEEDVPKGLMKSPCAEPPAPKPFEINLNFKDDCYRNPVNLSFLSSSPSMNESSITETFSSALNESGDDYVTANSTLNISKELESTASVLDNSVSMNSFCEKISSWKL